MSIASGLIGVGTQNLLGIGGVDDLFKSLKRDVKNAFEDISSNELDVDGIVDDLFDEIDKTRNGNNKDNTIRGDERNERINGKNGDDRLIGLGGDDILSGGRGDDQLEGGTGKDILAGDRGDDKLYGGAGDDLLYGGSGNDIIKGGTGRDVIASGEGNDVVYGGAGRDIFVFEDGNGSVTIKDFRVLQDKFTLPDDLKLSDVGLTQQGNNLAIFNGNDLLATLLNVSANQITAANVTVK
jgi:Ca2+-binding RTX toxin-like protein